MLFVRAPTFVKVARCAIVSKIDTPLVVGVSRFGTAPAGQSG
jgi:hypothetical protein